jgi:Caspase domain.
MRKAAAVVIGVDKTGGLDPLKSAASGARKVASWLQSEGFDVVCLTDGPGKSVTQHDVSTAITGFATKPATYEILVVYFSGHGQWHARADHWLLSGAPQNTAEAINLEGAKYMARRCGIPNVVFISDACRTIPKADVDSVVVGVDGFPNNAMPSISKIDYFMATSESRPAYEIPISGFDQSVLTRAIFSAFENPEPQIVKEISDGDQRASVVPNRLLETVLQTRVDAILDGVDGNPMQNLDTDVPSSDNVYIARVSAKAGPAPGAPPFPQLPKSPGDLSAEQIAYAARRRSVRMVPGRAEADAISDALRGTSGSLVSPIGVNRDEIEARIPDPAADHFETETGFIIRGARLADAAVSPKDSSEVDLLNSANDPRGDAVVVNPKASGLPVVVRLADGRCVVLAALRGYLGHAQFDEAGLANVSYVPSSNSWRWGAYNARREGIDRLRALVALAVERNSFRVRSEREAVQLAERIRVLKALDPTLGLYAAYAFAQAGIDGQVRDILVYMHNDLGLDLFDVRMLSGAARDRPTGVNHSVPFCPMLTQGWNLLRAYGVQVPDVLAHASRFLSNSLWSTFTGRGASIVFDAVKSGELQ